MRRFWVMLWRILPLRIDFRSELLWLCSYWGIYRLLEPESLANRAGPRTR